MRIKFCFSLLICCLFISCSSKKRILLDPPKKDNHVLALNENIYKTSLNLIDSSNSNIKKLTIIELNDSTFVNLKNYSNNFVFDLKYASSDNFLKAKVYDCSECYLRLKTVKALLIANEKFLKKGYRIKLFDCYRPLDVQKKMWKIVSNPEYVADPKKGSIHNRGGAVDITLVDFTGEELDMGTPFDFFGVQASHHYENLSKQVLKNRKLLKKIMTNSNFKIFESEWWHYNLKDANKDAVSNFKWNCN